MITATQVEQLQQFRDNALLITSCYLNLDRGSAAPAELKIRLKDLLQTARRELQAKAATHEQRESLQHDFERIETHVLQDSLAGRHRALAVFACAGRKFWQVCRLPRFPRNILIADHVPYLRPLQAILAAHRRFAVLVLDRSHGQLFNVYLGELVEHPLVNGAVPRRVREAGFGGREERGMERRHDGAVHQHYRHLAEATLAALQRQPFDCLVLAGPRAVLAEFKRELHPYLRQRWVADLAVEPGRITPPEILEQTLDVEAELELRQGRQLAEEIAQAAGDRAVTGLTATLAAVARGEAQMLVVEEGWEQPGGVCRACRQASVEAANCPQCGQPLEPCPDVVAEAVEQAAATQCGVRQVPGATALRDHGRIGALRRYRA